VRPRLPTRELLRHLTRTRRSVTAPRRAALLSAALVPARNRIRRSSPGMVPTAASFVHRTQNAPPARTVAAFHGKGWSVPAVVRTTSAPPIPIVRRGYLAFVAARRATIARTCARAVATVLSTRVAGPGVTVLRPKPAATRTPTFATPRSIRASTTRIVRRLLGEMPMPYRCAHSTRRLSIGRAASSFATRREAERAHSPRRGRLRSSKRDAEGWDG
jgi:hypothetical protein